MKFIFPKIKNPIKFIFGEDKDKLLNDETDLRRLYKNPSNIDIKNENIDSNPENKFISLDTKMEILSASEKLKKIFPQIKLIVNEFEPVRIDQYEVYLKIPFFSKNFDPLI